ncbi:MAG TPA: transcriptional regulator [Deltaproteobacteria bacterium]|nr:MAG: transcriptional regulator [Deltaproteobacteria bacterium GWA2_55_82]OIJ73926.1 MAG: transcriptional regulator [Deltaproteobacteria bacterium GWC2_55_46]HBG46519.1 transcriptional regulator [Deltaproteobacteria bacterium]HCY09921.1 transcriptional regulator [Deltaproteobacteria bacterium]
MRLSTKGQYAVRAMVNLACHSGERPVTLKGISAEEGISLSYLEQLFVKLRKGRIVKSVRGPGGGYVLAKDASLISVGEIIAVVEEPLNPVACLDEDSAGCDRATRCTTQRVWKCLAEKIAEFLNSVSIDDLSREANALKNGQPRVNADLCGLTE